MKASKVKSRSRGLSREHQRRIAAASERIARVARRDALADITARLDLQVTIAEAISRTAAPTVDTSGEAWPLLVVIQLALAGQVRGLRELQGSIEREREEIEARLG